MANQKQLDILSRGVGVWNQWYAQNLAVETNLDGADLCKAKLKGVDFHLTLLNDTRLREADLNGANLSGALLFHADLYKADLSGADLTDAALCYAHLDGANLCDADLRKANLSDAFVREVDFRNADLRGAFLFRALFTKADLRGANLRGAHLDDANLSEADLSGACLSEARLSRANLTNANLSEADLTEADLSGATLVRTNFIRATLTGSNVYGISAWNVDLKEATQSNLVITPKEEPAITVDNLEIAQFIYLLLNNDRLRKVIDTITSKVVLILGRFTPERKLVLDRIREELRNRNYLPVVFDFEKPSQRDLTETVSTLAHMAKFVIADLTDAKSLPQELASIVPFLPSVPVQPILLASEREWGMYEHFPRYPWVLNVVRYETVAELVTNLADRVIGPAERWLAATMTG